MSNDLEQHLMAGNICQYLKDKAQNHNYLKIYGSKKKIESIIHDGSILLSNGKGWNDKREEERLSIGENQMFACCFSFSKSESIAMWMLYAREKEDLMINLKPRVIRNIIQTKPTIEIGTLSDDKKFISHNKVDAKNYEIELIDVLYCDCISDKSAIKRSDERVEDVNRQFLENKEYWKKSYPWNYENECRLIVKIKKEYMDNELNARESTHVRVQLWKNDGKDNYDVYNNPILIEKTMYRRSSLADEVIWDLCKGCIKINKDM